MDENTKKLLAFFLAIIVISIFFLYKKSFIEHDYDTFFSENEEIAE